MSLIAISSYNESGETIQVKINPASLKYVVPPKEGQQGCAIAKLIGAQTLVSSNLNPGAFFSKLGLPAVHLKIVDASGKGEATDCFVNKNAVSCSKYSGDKSYSIITFLDGEQIRVSDDQKL